MTDFQRNATSRRQFLKTSGTMLAMIPVVNLLGCADDSPPPAPQPARPAPPAQQPPAAAPAQPSPAAAMPKLEESDATARALGYVHDANDVDASQQPRFQDGQLCENCALYTPDSSDEADWGGCSIFPGKLVNAKGWCNAWVAKR
ncbi:MAG: high-potential iron-sulfur protein [Gammaproteobacteria bacterium]|nr:high-potential iron-sulfur protein [Gammaproteobacteria bacterium]